MSEPIDPPDDSADVSPPPQQNSPEFDQPILPLNTDPESQERHVIPSHLRGTTEDPRHIILTWSDRSKTASGSLICGSILILTTNPSLFFLILSFLGIGVGLVGFRAASQFEKKTALLYARSLFVLVLLYISITVFLIFDLFSESGQAEIKKRCSTNDTDQCTYQVLGEYIFFLLICVCCCGGCSFISQRYYSTLKEFHDIIVQGPEINPNNGFFLTENPIPTPQETVVIDLPEDFDEPPPVYAHDGNWGEGHTSLMVEERVMALPSGSYTESNLNHPNIDISSLPPPNPLSHDTRPQSDPSVPS